MTPEESGLEYQPLNRAGDFKVKPISWNVFNAESGAVAININFSVLAQWDGSEWVSWADAAPYMVRGAFYVVKRDGAVNAKAVEQLVKHLKWDGQFISIVGDPPDVEVQVNVKEEIYNGTSVYKAAWINAANAIPGGGGATEEEIKNLDGRFGSLLRAAAGMVK